MVWGGCVLTLHNWRVVPEKELVEVLVNKRTQTSKGQGWVCVGVSD